MTITMTTGSAFNIYFLFCLTGYIIGQKTITLNGAGASFPWSVYQKWLPNFSAYREEHVDVIMNYDVIGSSSGRNRIMNKEGPPVDYAASDNLLSVNDYEELPDLQMLPAMAGAVVVAFNLPGIAELNLTRDDLVGIYNGTIRYWNDTYLQSNNKGVDLPFERILPLARAEKSGTTYLFTSALADFSDEFNKKYGTFNVPSGFEEDVIHLLGRTSRGIAGLMISIDYTIAYFSVADASEYGITSAKIQNKQGEFIGVNYENVQKAMDYFADSFTDRLTGSLTDPNATGAYPIAGYTYLVVRMAGMEDCDKALELYRYIKWAVTSDKARRVCIQYNMVPLSDIVAQKVLDKLESFTCQGQSVADLARAQQRKEMEDNSWLIPVAVGLPVSACVLFVISALLAYRDYKLGRMLQDFSWKVNSDDIDLTANRPSKNNHQKGASSVTHVSGEKISGLWGTIDGATVNLKRLITHTKTAQEFSKKDRLALHMLKNDMGHPNLARFYGLTGLEKGLYLVSEHSARGTLEDVIYEESEMDDIFKYSIAIDIASAIIYLHRREIVHGALTSRKCIIDNKWTCKVCDWEYNHLRDVIIVDDGGAPVEAKSFHSHLTELIQPEAVLNRNEKLTKSSDIYSLSVLIYEVFTRRYILSVTPGEDIYQIMLKIAEEPLFDYSMYEKMPTGIRTVLRSCLSISSKERPTPEKILESLRKNNPSDKAILDCILEKLEKKTVELKVHMENFEKLLYEMLPQSVAKKLTSGETIEPEWFDEVTVYFSDVVGFTNISADSSPIEIVDFLNDLYTTFDAILDKFDCYKVETIGDAYMIVSGLPRRNGSEHAVHIANLSIDIAAASSSFRIRHRPNETLAIRIGMHTGPVASGVVGRKMPRYCLFGDTVNTASRMESTSVAMKIQVSQTTQAILDQNGCFILKQRGVINVKGKGEMKTFWLHGRIGGIGQMAPEFLRDIEEDFDPNPRK